MFPTFACKSASDWGNCKCVCSSVCACVCLCATSSFINRESDRRYNVKAELVRDEIAFSAPLLLTFTLSNGTEQGLQHKAPYSTTACTPTNIGDPNLNHAHNWIIMTHREWNLEWYNVFVLFSIENFFLLLIRIWWHPDFNTSVTKRFSSY